jgi:hypothetical protein
MPSVPTQLMLKYDPPKITIVYHFEQRENERFYHDIPVERRLLETLSDDEITSHLYVTEAYYFNPKQIKRQQVSESIVTTHSHRSCVWSRNSKRACRLSYSRAMASRRS